MQYVAVWSCFSLYHLNSLLDAMIQVLYQIKTKMYKTRKAAGLRLGAPLHEHVCAVHTCRCGSTVDTRGTHGLSCKFSAGRQSRHAHVNDLLQRTCVNVGVAASKEPSGLLPGSQLRPDGVSLIPWTAGRCAAWDFTCPDTLAESHLQYTSATAGAAAERASTLKKQKYSTLQASHLFVPVAVETLEAWNDEGMQLVKEVGRRTTAITSERREAAFLFQRLSVAVQRGNMLSVLGTLSSVDD